jgi:hypothetical protein
MSRSLKYLLVIFITLSFITHANAQESQDNAREETTTNGAPTDPSTDPGDPDVPIDGGISLLVAAGIGYGAKKRRDELKKRNSEAEINVEK